VRVVVVRWGTLAVGTVCALQSFSRIAGAICSRRKTREHGRGCRSWVRSSRVWRRKRAVGLMRSRSRVV